MSIVTFLKRRRSPRIIILRYCEVQVHGVLESEDYTAAAASGRRQRNAVDVDGNGGRSHGGIDIQINGGGDERTQEVDDDDDEDYDEEEEEEEEGEEGEGSAAATDDVEEAICIAATAGDRTRSILHRLRWKSGGGGADAKVRFLENHPFPQTHCFIGIDRNISEKSKY